MSGLAVQMPAGMGQNPASVHVDNQALRTITEIRQA